MFSLRRLSSVALLSLISLPAWAQAKPAQPSVVEMILPFGLMFVIFYFLIIRPQSKRAKQHEEMISALRRGDEVLTSSGIFGTIDGLTDQFVTLQIAEGVKIKILRKQISGSVAALTNTQEGKK
jgi:preprotein translocase subunit YajC